MSFSTPFSRRVLRAGTGFAALILAVAFAAPSAVAPARAAPAEPSAAQPAPPERQAIEKIVKEYILSNPEIIRDAMIELDRRQSAKQAEEQKLAANKHAKDLFNSEHDFVIGNPNGDVTLVEFFDYNCGYCKGALPALAKLIENDPNLRVVLKEFPILSEGSVEAAHYSLAAAPQGKYFEYHRAMLGARGEMNGARALQIAERLGLDVDQIKAQAKSDRVREAITTSMRLASALGVNGTPSYVIGDDVIVGAVGYEDLKEKIDTLREEKTTEGN